MIDTYLDHAVKSIAVLVKKHPQRLRIYLPGPMQHFRTITRVTGHVRSSSILMARRSRIYMCDADFFYGRESPAFGPPRFPVKGLANSRGMF
jgi:hypothetical protein